MSTLKRARAVLALTALLSVLCAEGVALSAQGSGSAQQTTGIIALRHAAEGDQTRIILEGTAELPYTIYRPDERTVLVDLPGVSATTLNDSYAVGSNAVDSIQVERLRTASGQTLARLRIRLRAAAEERTLVEGKNLVVTLAPRAATPEPAAAPAPAVAQPPVSTGTGGDEPAMLRADAPVTLPKPALEKVAPAAAVPDKAATVISSMRTEVQDGKFRAIVSTDGRAPFKHFILPDPNRIVVDVTGVRNGVERNSLAVNQGGVSRVRIGQFRTNDPRVVRIVFDVRKMGPYTVRQVGSDLVLTLGEETRADAPVASAPAAPPQAAPLQAAPIQAAPQPSVATNAPAPAPKKADALPSVMKPIEDETGDEPEAVKPASPAPASPVERTVDTARVPTAMNAPAQERAASGDMLAVSTVRAATPARVLQETPPGPVLPPATQNGYGTEGYVGKVINFDLKGVDLRDMLRYLHQEVGVNFIVDQAVPAIPVTISVKGVPWNVTLDAVLKANGLGAVREGPIIRIATQAGIGTERQLALEAEQKRFDALPLVTKIFKLKYITSSRSGPAAGGQNTGAGGGGAAGGDIISIIRNRLSRRGKVEIDGRSNRVIVTDLAARLDVIDQIVRTLDRPEPQVEIEARIVVARRQFLRDLGVQLAAAAVNRSTGGAAVISTLPNTTTTDGIPGIAFPPSDANGRPIGQPGVNIPGGLGGSTQPVPSLRATGASTVVSLTTGILGTFQISAQITAAERKAHARTVSSPRVTAQNNSAAEVIRGVQIPVQTVTNNTITTTYVTAALRLQITPQIIVEDGAVQLTVLAENNDVDRTIQGQGGTPGINTQSASAVVLVPDGGTTIIGGITTDIESQAQNRTPGLSRIPIIGNLFKQRSTQRDTEEIIFFITPRIFRPELVGIPETTSVRSSDITIIPLIPAGSESGGASLTDTGSSGVQP